MSFQAYLDNIKAKTGKTPEDFARLAGQRGLTRHGEIVAWLKSDFGLGHGHANAIVAVLLKSASRAASPEDKLRKLFSGKKAVWLEACTALIATLEALSDVTANPNETYVNLLKGKKKFAILQPGSAERLDLGLKLKGVAATERLEAAGSWNATMTHRVRITDPAQMDAELLGWLRQAHDAA